MARLPYNQDVKERQGRNGSGSLSVASGHNPLGFSATEHPAGAVFQRLECDPYKVEVAGSNPARPIQLSRGLTAWVSPEDYERVSATKWSACEPYPGKLYACAIVDGRWTYLHRFILNAPKGKKVDHRNGDGLDCRRENLRLATSLQNAQNRHAILAKSGFKGVVVRRDRYEARICHAGRRRSLGRFDCPILAACAYDVAAREFFGEFARPNFKFVPLEAQ